MIQLNRWNMIDNQTKMHATDIYSVNSLRLETNRFLCVFLIESDAFQVSSECVSAASQ